MLPMLPSLGGAREESEAVTNSVPVLSQKRVGNLWNHLWNCASRTQYLEPSDTEPAVAHTLPIMVFFFLFLFAPLFSTFLPTVYIVLCKPGCAVSAADMSSV